MTEKCLPMRFISYQCGYLRLYSHRRISVSRKAGLHSLTKAHVNTKPVQHEACPIAPGHADWLVPGGSCPFLLTSPWLWECVNRYFTTSRVTVALNAYKWGSEKQQMRSSTSACVCHKDKNKSNNKFQVNFPNIYRTRSCFYSLNAKTVTFGLKKQLQEKWMPLIWTLRSSCFANFSFHG